MEFIIKDEGVVDSGEKKGLRNHRFVLTILIQPGDSIVKIADKISSKFSINCSSQLLLEYNFGASGNMVLICPGQTIGYSFCRLPKLVSCF
ncbi:LysM peptidoglycan-binding domain-containing protein [Patescibacteria group bacterium]|nr:LysM peptidoglycan-binding domain-containing protein [Patescibacteria group bacterium]